MTIDSGTTTRLKALLIKNPKAKVLLVGTKDGNVDDDLRSHPQTIFWDSNHPAARKKAKLPLGLVAVIFLRFLSTGWYQRIKREAKRKQIWFTNDTLSTGELRRILGEILPPKKDVESKLYELSHRPDGRGLGFHDIPPLDFSGRETFGGTTEIRNGESVVLDEKVIVSTVLDRGGGESDLGNEIDNLPERERGEEIVPKKTERAWGGIKKFAFEHFRSGEKPENEANRVRALAVQAGIDTTLRYMQFLYYVWRKNQNVLRPTTSGEPATGRRVTRSGKSGDVEAPGKLPQASGRSDFKAIVEDVRASLSLLTESLVRFFEKFTDLEKTDDELARLRKIEGKFNRLRKDLEDSDEE